jgi:ATP-dependent protease HslVU (ClpYQ) peptidase subunit
VTVIAGWKDRKQAWIAGDSGAFDDTTVVLSAEPKVWKTDTSLVGVSGSFRIMDLLRHANCGGKAEEIRDFLIARANANDFPSDDWAVLVVDKTGVYEIGSDFAIVKSRENYGSIGAGAQAALAALSVLERIKDVTPRRRMELVMKATEKHTTNARPPFKILSL